jgi:hypothetical protein
MRPATKEVAAMAGIDHGIERAASFWSQTDRVERITRWLDTNRFQHCFSSTVFKERGRKQRL